MSPKMKIALIVVIALMAGLGFAATDMIGRQAQQLDIAQQRIAELVSQQQQGEQAEPTLSPSASSSTASSDFVSSISNPQIYAFVSLITQVPKVTTISTASGSYLIFDWAPADSNDRAISVWYQHNISYGGSVAQAVYTDAMTCDEDCNYAYAMINGMLQVKSVNSNEFGGEIQEAWFDDEGGQIIRYNYEDGYDGNHDITFALDDGTAHVLSLAFDATCSAIQNPNPQAMLENKGILPQQGKLLGMKIDQKMTSLSQPINLHCIEHGSEGDDYIGNPEINFSIVGTKVRYQIPSEPKQTLDIDLKNPSKIVSSTAQ